MYTQIKPYILATECYSCSVTLYTVRSVLGDRMNGPGFETR